MRVVTSNAGKCSQLECIALILLMKIVISGLVRVNWIGGAMVQLNQQLIERAVVWIHKDRCVGCISPEQPYCMKRRQHSHSECKEESQSWTKTVDIIDVMSGNGNASDISYDCWSGCQAHAQVFYSYYCSCYTVDVLSRLRSPRYKLVTSLSSVSTQPWASGPRCASHVETFTLW